MFASEKREREKKNSYDIFYDKENRKIYYVCLKQV